VARAVDEIAPGLIINCAAFNNVDAAEVSAARRPGRECLRVRSLARAAQRHGATLVHYSTDFVFDGRASEPYPEDAPTSPQSTYAASKLLGEWFALEAPRALSAARGKPVRSPAGWSGRRGTVDAILDGVRSGREVPVLTDRVVSPSYSPDVAAATRHLLEGGPRPVSITW
jgi:dTDP-4-dehydrorhamnose reductase